MINSTSDLVTISDNVSNESNDSFLQFLNSTFGCDERPPSFHWPDLQIHNAFQIYSIGFTLIAIGSFLSNLLTIQTVLCCKDIRITNLGVYLVLFSICSLGLALLQTVWINLIYISGKDQVPPKICFALVLLVQTLCFLCAMFWASLGMERALVQCRQNYSLLDSRRHSFLFSCIIFSLVLINIFTDIFSQQHSSLEIVECDRRYVTKTSLIISIVLDCVYTTVSFLIFFLTSLIVLRHLSKRRNYLLANAVSDANVTHATTLKMWLKHPDFYFSPFIYPLTMVPRFIFHTFLNCDAVHNSKPLAWFDVFSTFLAYSANTFTFFVYILPSTVYMRKFWQRSIVGLLLIWMKQRCLQLIGYCRR